MKSSAWTTHSWISISNIAVIAHVDHGPTTLVNALLHQTNVICHATQAKADNERVIDSSDQEHNHGITILAKNLAMMHNGYKINIMDTSGHADFWGEVECVLNICNGVLLVVPWRGPSRRPGLPWTRS